MSMEKCRKCRHVDSWEKCEECYEGCNFEGNTNGNKIRSMSDEELAEYLSELIRNAHEYHTGEGDWLQWLKSEAKEET